MLESKSTTPQEQPKVPAVSNPTVSTNVQHSSSAGLLVLICVLAASFAAAGWYLDRRQDVQAEKFGQITGLQASLDGLKSRVDATEAGARDWTDRWSKLAARLNDVENRAGEVLASAKHQTEKIVNDAQARLDTRIREIDDKTGQLSARLQQVESSNRTQRAELERLRGELATSQREIADLRRDTTQDLKDVRAASDQTATRLDDRVGGLERARQTQRVDFELARSHNQHLLPGVTLDVESVDAAHQRYNGWVWLLQDRRTVWIKNQDAQVPLLIYPKAGGQPLRLVVNQVTAHDVTGYLLIPESQTAYAQAAEVASGGN